MTTRYDCNGYRTGGHIGRTFDKVARDVDSIDCRIRRVLSMIAAVSPTRWIGCGDNRWCILAKDGEILASAWFYAGMAHVQYGELTKSADTMQEAVAGIPNLPEFDAPLTGWQRALGHGEDRHEHHDGRKFWRWADEWAGNNGERNEYAETLEALFKLFGWTDFAEVEL